MCSLVMLRSVRGGLAQVRVSCTVQWALYTADTRTRLRLAGVNECKQWRKGLDINILFCCLFLI